MADEVRRTSSRQSSWSRLESCSEHRNIRPPLLFIGTSRQHGDFHISSPNPGPKYQKCDPYRLLSNSHVSLLRSLKLPAKEYMLAKRIMCGKPHAPPPEDPLPPSHVFPVGIRTATSDPTYLVTMSCTLALESRIRQCNGSISRFPEIQFPLVVNDGRVPILKASTI